ncbi:MAG: serine/threonine protein kinase, partial [Myxococcales bacterium]|nr:serine/threonine protein kinase [Myxococcales bacterium]
RAVQIALAAGAIMLLFGWWGGLALGDAVTVIMVGMAGMLTATSIALSLRLRVASVSAFVAVAALLLPGPRALWLFLALVAVVVAVVKGLRRLVREVADEASPEEPVGPGVPPPLSSLPERRDTPPPPHEEAATWRESHGPRGTELMVEERRTEGPVVERPPWVEVSELPVIHTAGAGSRLRLEGEMGRGGMGKVHAGLEIPLRRRVAVKTAAPEGSPAATAALLREAYVAGLLDHPNVVPVHVLGRDDRGQPLLVMKYVEGTRWSTALASPDRFARLDHHLGIFMQVCHAIDYAHHRGIVHRDIKASNVMVGAFGEVQVLDWGLAAALGDEHRGVLPLTSDIAVPEGTAAYMAPEMVRADGGAIGVATDVYLLGGLLHFLLTGAPPHAGCSLADRVADPSQVVRVVAPRAPRELAAICARALDPNPRARYGSAAAMREAVASYLEHRASLELTVSALSRVSALAELLASPDPPPGEVNALSLEARFGFREALRIWPDNHRAQAGLQRVLELACRYAIERGDEEAGRALYLALPEPNPVLEQRLDDLARERRERDARVRELEALRQGVDLAVDKRSRMWGAVVLGGLVVVAVAGLTAARLLGLHEAGYVDAVVIVALTTILNGYLQLSQRSRTNEANVRLHRFLVTCLFAATVHLLACWRLGVGFTFGLALLMLLFAVMAFLSAALMSWLVVPTGACFLLAASALMIWPELRPLLLIAGFGLAFGSLAVAARFIESATWWPEPRAKAGSRPPC